MRRPLTESNRKYLQTRPDRKKTIIRRRWPTYAQAEVCPVIKNHHQQPQRKFRLPSCQGHQIGGETKNTGGRSGSLREPEDKKKKKKKGDDHTEAMRGSVSNQFGKYGLAGSHCGCGAMPGLIFHHSAVHIASQVPPSTLAAPNYSTECL